MSQPVSTDKLLEDLRSAAARAHGRLTGAETPETTGAEMPAPRKQTDIQRWATATYILATLFMMGGCLWLGFVGATAGQSPEAIWKQRIPPGFLNAVQIVAIATVIATLVG